MYPYHNKIKQRIKASELVAYRFEDNYPRIGECLVLECATQPFRQPIRPHRYVEYVDILVAWKRGEFECHSTENTAIA